MMTHDKNGSIFMALAVIFRKLKAGATVTCLWVLPAHSYYPSGYYFQRRHTARDVVSLSVCLRSVICNGSFRFFD